MLNVIMLSIVMLNVVMLSVVVLFFCHNFHPQCYTKFFHNLRIFVISLSVSPWQAFPA
jgi:hypothetical protein